MLKNQIHRSQATRLLRKRSRLPNLMSAVGMSVACLSALHGLSKAYALPLYWMGGNGSFNSTANWSTVPTAATPATTLLPTANDDLTFNITPSNTLAGNITVDAFQFANSMTFATSGATTFTAGTLNGANPYVLNLGNLSLSNSGLTLSPGAGTVRFGDGANPTNDAALTLVGRNVWTNQSSSSVVLNMASASSFTRAAGSTINFNQSGTGRFTTSSNVLQNTNSMVGAWAFFGNAGAGSLRYATNSSGTIAAYSGATSIADASAITDTTGNVNYTITNTVNPTTIATANVSFNTLLYTAGSATINHNGISINGILNTGGNSVTIAGTATSSIGSTRELVINCDKTNSSIGLTTTFTNNASGASSIIKTGLGALTISSGQTITGGLYVTQGLVTANRAVTASGTLAISAGAIFTNNATGQTIGALIGAGQFTHVGTTSATDTLSVGNNNASGQFDGNITNTSSTRLLAFTKTGNGLQALGGTNSYGGNTTVNGSAGVLQVNRPSALSNYTVSGRVVISNGFLVFRVGDGSTGFTTAQIDTALAAATKATTGNPGIGVDTTNGDVTQWGAFNVPNNFGFAKTGPGTFTFNQATPLTGNILVRAGTIAFTGTASFSQAASGSTTLGAGTVSGGALTYDSSAASTFGSITVGNGTISQSTFTQTGGTITATSLTLNNGYTAVGTGTFNLSNGVFTVGTVVASNQVAADNVFSNISISGGTFTATGAFYLTGNPAAARWAAGRVNQTGGTVTATGTLASTGLVLARTTASNANPRRGEYNLDGGLLVTSGVSLEAGPDTFGTFNLNGGTLQASTSSATFLTGLTLANVRNGGAKIDTAGSTITIGQLLAHSNIAGDNATDGGLTKIGAGTLILTTTPTYTGPTTISGGTLQYGDGTSTVALPNVVTNNGNLAVNRPDDLTYSGTVSGTGSLTKLGSNTLTLSGSVAYTGDTTVTGGNLVVNSPLRPVTGSLVVTGPGATARLNASPTTTSASGYTVAGQFASISVSASGTITLPVINRSQNKANVLIANSLAIASGGVLDLGNGDLILRGGASQLSDLLTWAASGTLTALGASNPLSANYLPNTALAVFVNDSGDNVNPYFSSYDGVSNLQLGDVIIKYTHKADLNLDGIVDGQDYRLALEGYLFGRTGWLNGDINYSGSVTAEDFNTFVAAYDASSNISLGKGASDPSATSSIPEPKSLALFTPALAVMGRRRRS